MSDDEGDGGEHTNAEYYGRVWTKPIKQRTEPKKAKVKSKEVIHLCDILVGTLKHLRRSHRKGVNSTISPLFRS